MLSGKNREIAGQSRTKLLTADLRGFTLINQKPLKHGGTEAAEENQTPEPRRNTKLKGEGHEGKQRKSLRQDKTFTNSETERQWLNRRSRGLYIEND
jgi:hypothetical protein